MGYYIFSFSISPEKVKQSFDSKDTDFFEAVVETEEFECYSEEDFAGHTSTRQALEQLLLGKRHSLLSKYNKNSAHSYWYALIAICARLGEKMPSTHEIKFGYETDLINEYLKSDFGITVKVEELLLNGDGGFFGLPKVEDWPLCGLLSKEQLVELNNNFSPVEITNEQLEQLAREDDEKEMAYDSIRQLKENIKYCIDTETCLISFCH